MSQQLNNNTDCCATECSNTTVNTPGPQGNKGDTGAAGANGTNGENAFTRTTAGFTMPAVGSNVAIGVLSANPFASPQNVFVDDAGYFEVVGTAAGVLTLKNLGYAPNVAPASVIATTNLLVCQAGLKGEDGANGTGIPAAFNAKGEVLVHDGTSENVLSPGADGEVVVYNSAEPLGVETRALSFSDITGTLDLSSQVSSLLALNKIGNTGGAQGDLAYWNGTAWVRVAPPTVDGDQLVYDLPNKKPVWSTGATSATLARLCSGRITYDPVTPLIDAGSTNIASVTYMAGTLRVAFTTQITASDPIVVLTALDVDAAGIGLIGGADRGMFVPLEDFDATVDPVTYPNGFIDIQPGRIGYNSRFNLAILG